MRRVYAAVAAALLLTGVGLAVTRDAGALPPLGTTSTETVNGFTFSFTYNGPEWIVINDTSSAGATYKRPNVSSLVMAQSGANASLGASECNMADAIDAMRTKYDLAPLGYFIGHSSFASVITKSIYLHPAANVACAGRLVAEFKGLGISGVAWRVDQSNPTTKYSAGGLPRPPNPWPANIRHVWWFTGVQHTPVNGYAVGGADEYPSGVQTWNMTITEAWHYTASMWGDPINLPTPVIPQTITSPVVFDHLGPDNHQRVLVTPGEGHVLASTAVDSDADYWATMLTPADQPPATTTTSSTTTTLPATTTTVATTTSTTVPATTTTVPATTSSTMPPPTVDPVREALVESVLAAQHALDVYDQAHP